MRLLECTAGPVSQDPSAANVLTSPEDCRSPAESTFILFIHNSEINRAGKRPF